MIHVVDDQQVIPAVLPQHLHDFLQDLVLRLGLLGGGVQFAVAAESICHRPYQGIPEAACKPYKKYLAFVALPVPPPVFNGKLGLSHPAKTPENDRLLTASQKGTDLSALRFTAHKFSLRQGGQVQSQLVFGRAQKVQHFFYAWSILAVQQFFGTLVSLGRIVVQQALHKLVDQSQGFRWTLHSILYAAVVRGYVKGLLVAAGIYLAAQHPVQQPAGRVQIDWRAEAQNPALQVPQLWSSITAGGVHHAIPYRGGEAVRLQTAGSAKIQQAAVAQLAVGQVGIQKKEVVALDVAVQIAGPMDRTDSLQYLFEDSERSVGGRDPSCTQRVSSAASDWLLCTICKHLVQKQSALILLLHDKEKGHAQVKIFRRGAEADTTHGDFFHRRKVKNAHCMAGHIPYLLVDLFFPPERCTSLFQQDSSLFRGAVRRLHNTVLAGPCDAKSGIVGGRKAFFENVADGAALFLGRINNTTAPNAYFACKDGIDLPARSDNTVTRVENLVFAFICFINVHNNPSSCCFMFT